MPSVEIRSAQTDPPTHAAVGPSRHGAADADVIGAELQERVALEVRLDGGPPSRRTIAESHVTIGRLPGLQMWLDHHTVSRRHAEMFTDPFGRWWIRDLGSTNGTIVNDEVVTERVLQPGDAITIGDFVLTFLLEQQRGVPAPAAHVTVHEDKPTAIRTLLDFGRPELSADHLRTLLELSRRLITLERAEERLDALCQLAVRSDFHGTLATVLRLTADGPPAMLTRPHRPASMAFAGQPYISRRVLSALRETREPVLAGNLRSAPTGSVDLTIAREVMELWVIGCPLGHSGTDLDVLYVTLPPDCGSAEWLSLFALAAEVYNVGEAAWLSRKHAQAHAAIERELDTARQIQRALLPTHLDFAGLDIAVGFDPCKWVGGDYLDVLEMMDGRVLMTVADVCGKGLQAALVASSLHTLVRATADSESSLPALVERVNRHLAGWLPAHSFVTMVSIAVAPDTGEIECVNAGHPPPFVVDRDGEVRSLQSAENPALGIARARMTSQRGMLDFGEVLTMYTDGLTEARNPSRQMLGEVRLGQRFAQLCSGLGGDRSDALASGLKAIVEEFRGNELPEDDRAFILARRVR
jgi:serine phosphatase RsbU (regulator of sigma subunit)/pSer/pThr/pTyr-binding forkhead associated (FHA) protein